MFDDYDEVYEITINFDYFKIFPFNLFEIYKNINPNYFNTHYLAIKDEFIYIISNNNTVKVYKNLKLVTKFKQQLVIKIKNYRYTCLKQIK